MRKKFVLPVLLFCLVQSLTFAEVADSGANGFTIKIVTSIHGAPADVYKKLVHNVGDWWNPQHTFSGDAHNLSIEERPMGCFCEKLANGGAVRHLEVVFLAPGKRLVLSGGLGPLQGIGAGGAMTFNLTSANDETKLEVTYVVTGYVAQGMNTWAAPVNGVLTEQITRLKNYIEAGNPAGPANQQKRPV